MNEDGTSIQLRSNSAIWCSRNGQKIRWSNQNRSEGGPLIKRRVASIKRRLDGESLISVRINKPSFLLWIQVLQPFIDQLLVNLNDDVTDCIHHATKLLCLYYFLDNWGFTFLPIFLSLFGEKSKRNHQLTCDSVNIFHIE